MTDIDICLTHNCSYDDCLCGEYIDARYTVSMEGLMKLTELEAKPQRNRTEEEDFRILNRMRNKGRAPKMGTA